MYPNQYQRAVAAKRLTQKRSYKQILRALFLNENTHFYFLLGIVVAVFALAIGHRINQFTPQQ